VIVLKLSKIDLVFSHRADETSNAAQRRCLENRAVGTSIPGGAMLSLSESVYILRISNHLPIRNSTRN
jgi:hypothetical protein